MKDVIEEKYKVGQLLRLPNGKIIKYNDLTQVLNAIKVNFRYDDNDQDQIDQIEDYELDDDFQNELD